MSQPFGQVRWYWQRLRNMPMAELGHRINEAWSLRTYGPSSVGSGLTLRRDGSRDLFGLQALSSDGARRRQNQICQQLEAGFIEVFGSRHEFSEPWSRDPFSGALWPTKPVVHMKYRSMGLDPKWSWEVHRLAYLLAPLLRVERYGDELSMELCQRTLRSWLQFTRPGCGIEWASAIEVAIRGLILSWVLQAARIDDAALLAAGQRSLAEHARWLRLFPSRFSSANNHRVAELAALLVIDADWNGALCPSERERLQRELVGVTASLFALDGIGLEQSPTYAGFTIELAAVALRSIAWVDPSLAKCLFDNLASAVATLRDFTDARGQLVGYGDDDEGKVLSWLVPEDEYVALLEELVGVAPSARHRGLTTFAAGGHSIMRYEDVDGFETMVTYDHAPLGFGDIAAHGHADVLSFTFQTDDVRWIVDPGTFRYHGNHEWRNYFRSTRVHNSPTLDGVDSSTMAGDFNWSKSRRARPILESCRADGEVASVKAQHDGYIATHGTRVRREITRTGPGHYQVIDTILDSAGSLVVMLTIPPGRDVMWSDDSWILSDRRSSVRVRIRPNDEGTTSTIQPRQEAVWFSERFGEKTAAWGLMMASRLAAGGRTAFDIFVEKAEQERIL